MEEGIAMSASFGTVQDHEPTFEELNDLTPMVKPGAEIEPVAFVDKSGSNEWPTAAGRNDRRWDLVGELMQGIVGKLSAADSQAEHEEDGGGVMTVTFADMPKGSNPAAVVGDLNPENFGALWPKIRIGGGTNAIPGWELLMQNYLEEFEDRPVIERPTMGVLGVTDGLMNDLKAFTDELGRLGKKVKVVIAVHGFDNEDAIAGYRAAEKAHPESLRVIVVTPEVSPDVVADAMLALLGK